MPYIASEKRVVYDGSIVNLGVLLKDVARGSRKGDVNYVISRIVLQAFATHGAWVPNSYHDISDAVSVLRDAADEIERRLMGPREDIAIAKNGDLDEYER
jgi:hypothetical protein